MHIHPATTPPQHPASQGFALFFRRLLAAGLRYADGNSTIEAEAAMLGIPVGTLFGMFIGLKPGDPATFTAWVAAHPCLAAAERAIDAEHRARLRETRAELRTLRDARLALRDASRNLRLLNSINV